MDFDVPTLIISLTVFISVFIFIYLFILRPLEEKKAQADTKELQAQILELKKQVGEYAGADRIEQVRNAERFQNVSVMNARAIIVQFVRWERPSRMFRDIMSLVSAGVITILIQLFIKDTHKMQGVDFAIIGGFMFFFSYYLWGAIIETYWKQKQLGRLQKEFINMMRLSANPLAARDGLLEWMTTSLDVNDKVRRLLEGMMDKWLRQNLDKFQ